MNWFTELVDSRETGFHISTVSLSFGRKSLAKPASCFSSPSQWPVPSYLYLPLNSPSPSPAPSKWSPSRPLPVQRDHFVHWDVSNYSGSGICIYKMHVRRTNWQYMSCLSAIVVFRLRSVPDGTLVLIINYSSRTTVPSRKKITAYSDSLASPFDNVTWWVLYIIRYLTP